MQNLHQYRRLSNHSPAHLTDPHVGPGPHVVGFEVQSLLVGGDGLSTLAGVGQSGAQLVPQGVVLGANLERCFEGTDGPVVVPGQVVQHSQSRLQSEPPW